MVCVRSCRKGCPNSPYIVGIPLTVVEKVMVDEISVVVGDEDEPGVMLPVVEIVPEAGLCDVMERVPDSEGLLVGNRDMVSDTIGTPIHGCSAGGDAGCG